MTVSKLPAAAKRLVELALQDRKPGDAELQEAVADVQAALPDKDK